MIFIQQKFCLGSCAIIVIVITACSLYAYRVNAKRAPGDPKKKDFSPFGIWLAPIILPLLFLANAVFLIFSSLVFGVLLVLFPFALLLFRKPFLIKWIRKQALKIGNGILTINTELLKAAGFHPAPIKLIYEKEALA